jgi:hypothetical protein
MTGTLFRKSIWVAKTWSSPFLNEKVRSGARSNAQTNLPKSLTVETSR